MKLTERQLQMLRNADLVEMSHKARQKAAALLNDQGFAVFSIAVSNIIAEVVEHPEKFVKEFGS
jgi:3-dehydroquinate dehydratase